MEEDFADDAVWELKFLSREKHVMPWRIEDEMKRIGANYVDAELSETRPRRLRLQRIRRRRVRRLSRPIT